MSAFTYDVRYRGEPQPLDGGVPQSSSPFPHRSWRRCGGTSPRSSASCSGSSSCSPASATKASGTSSRAGSATTAVLFGYVSLLFDRVSGIRYGPWPGPVRSEISFEEHADRLSSALRLIWIIPAAIMGFFIARWRSGPAGSLLVCDPLHRQAVARHVGVHAQGASVTRCSCSRTAC